MIKDGKWLLIESKPGLKRYRNIFNRRQFRLIEDTARRKSDKIYPNTNTVYSIANGNDDGYSQVDNWQSWMTTQNDLYFGEHPGVPGRHWRAFMRWSLDIPAGAVIGSAYLKVRSYGGLAGHNFITNIYLLDQDNCLAFTFDPYNLAVSGSPVSWLTGNWSYGSEYTSSDIATIVQAFIDRGGYVVNNYIGIRLDEGNSVSQLHRISAYEYRGTLPQPKLDVTYEAGLDLIKGIDETVQISDEASHRKSIVQSIAETEQVSDEPVYLKAIALAVTETVQLIDELGHLKSIVLEISESEELQDELGYSKAMSRQISETENLSDELVHRKSIFQLIEDIEQLDDEVGHRKAIVQLIQEIEQLSDEAYEVLEAVMFLKRTRVKSLVPVNIVNELTPVNEVVSLVPENLVKEVSL